MKNLTLTIIAVLALYASYAQNTGWKEMNRFHGLSNVVFHSAEAGNLKPVKDSAAVVLAVAKAWKTSPMPAVYNPKIINPLLNKLVEECTALNDAVATKKKDSVIRGLASKAHDTFHSILHEASASE